MTQVTRNAPPGLEEYNPFTDAKPVSLFISHYGDHKRNICLALVSELHLVKVFSAEFFICLTLSNRDTVSFKFGKKNTLLYGINISFCCVRLRPARVPKSRRLRTHSQPS